MHSGPSHFKHLLHINIEYSVGSRVGRKGYTLIQKKFESKTSTFYIVSRSLDPHSPSHAHSTRPPSFGPKFVAIQASNGTFRMENEHFWTAGIMPGLKHLREPNTQQYCMMPGDSKNVNFSQIL